MPSKLAISFQVKKLKQPNKVFPVNEASIESSHGDAQSVSHLYDQDDEGPS